MTALIVGATIGIFAAYCLLARDAYRDAAQQRDLCIACNPTLGPVRLRVTFDTDQFRGALNNAAAAFTGLADAARRANERLQPLTDLPPTDRPNRSTAFFLTAAERWENWRDRNGSATYVPKHRAPRGGTR